MGLPCVLVSVKPPDIADYTAMSTMSGIRVAWMVGVARRIQHGFNVKGAGTGDTKVVAFMGTGVLAPNKRSRVDTLN